MGRGVSSRAAGLRESPGDAGVRARAAPKTVVIGLLAAPGLSREIADRLAQELPARLSERYGETEWRIEVAEERLASASAPADVDLGRVVRRRMLEAAWDLVICLTDQPLLVRRRPVTAHVSTTHGVGLISVPALGAIDLEDRVEEAVLRVLQGLLGGSFTRSSGSRRQSRIRRRLEQLGSPLGDIDRDQGTVRFVSNAVEGNVRLLLGMVRTNRPWRLVAGLSGALVAALGAGAFGMVSTGAWKVAEGLGFARLIALCAAAVAVTCLTLVLAHDLWEHAPSPAQRERVLLANLTTAITIVIGVLTLFAALLIISIVCISALITRPVLADTVGHYVDAYSYLKVALLLSMLATLGGALGSALESDEVVRAAAYCYRGDE
jgi:hypothetical protein